MKEVVWIVGSGKMAREYVRALVAIGQPFAVIGRGERSAALLESDLGVSVARGGLACFLREAEPPRFAIVATQISELVPAVELLIERGVTDILVEKPVSLYPEEVTRLLGKCESLAVSVSVAYNRRFYPSVRKAMDLVNADGGLRSLRFDFTEFAQATPITRERREVLDRWVIANSSHVLDLAFFLVGKPLEMKCTTIGSTDWHPEGAIFSGHGVGSRGIPFSYLADWSSAGRWSVELRSQSLRLLLEPLESVQDVDWMSGSRSSVDLGHFERADLKPGLFEMVKTFLNKDPSDLCTLEEHSKMMSIYEEIAGYQQSTTDSM